MTRAKDKIKGSDPKKNLVPLWVCVACGKEHKECVRACTRCQGTVVLKVIVNDLARFT